MSLIKTAGRADVAAAYKALGGTPNNFMVAIGRGESWWGSQQQVLLPLTADHAQINPAHVPVTGVVIRSADAATLYQVGTDYTVDLQTGAIVRVVTGTIPAGVTLQATYIAKVPQPTIDGQTLVDEVGRVPVSSILYVIPFAEAADPEAEFILVEGAKYALSAQPTRMLLFRAHLDAGDGVGDPIREYGLFSRCATDPALPPGQVYYEGDDITQPGVLVIAKNRSPVPHDGTIGLDMDVFLEI